ncbi:hypothetical protein [Curtobacterium sp. MCSS17_007]|uniref:hypothetical protein n=1 Tax=Curtobacterium sp. MCSS17_007 TaxID=2175646 RepID=UPI000DA9E740|nr:hypothetical protein [Curtobacterium sp. MCSS17_007]WIE75608.1 hypothetical protein DEJ22_015385 [Curtobacterium sp. MCSS17_007]
MLSGGFAVVSLVYLAVVVLLLVLVVALIVLVFAAVRVLRLTATEKELRIDRLRVDSLVDTLGSDDDGTDDTAASGRPSGPSAS